MNTYILSFNKPTIPKEVKIGYCLERVQRYIPVPLKCFNVKDMATTGRAQTCGKCGDKDPGLTEENSPNKTKCPNCQKNHPAF